MSKSRGRKRFGILVPFTNSNLEPDMALMRPEAVSLHVARMGGYDEDEIPDDTQMQGLGAADFDEPLKLLMGVKPDVVFYGCTSATLTHGPAFDQLLAQKIRAQSGAHTVTAAGALVNALKAFQATQIGFASPYTSTINNMAVQFLDNVGVNTVARSEMDVVLDNHGQGALEPEEVFRLGLKADHPQAQVLVLSCTDMRSVEIIAQLEAMVRKPVITSNQAMLFQALQLLSIEEAIPGYGKLLERRRA